MTPEATLSSKSDQAARLLLLRATFGARPGDLDRVLKKGTGVWLEEQLTPERIDDGPVEERLSELETLGLSTSALMEKYPRPTREEREAGAKGGGRRRGDGPGRVLLELSRAKLLRAVHSERQLQEVMTDFWFNHFNVYARKNRNTLLTIAAYEREAIRPHALGRFEDLLLSTAEHPAMLFYLDNWINTREGFHRSQLFRGPRGRRRPNASSRKFGTNENYARELLELHTLGVDGGYEQTDVVEVARALTGWSVVGPRAARQWPDSLPPEGSFIFIDIAHDDAPSTVLGTRVARGGVEDGRAVISLLSRHPSTARFVSRKLARRFVADDPSDTLVGAMTETFLRTGGEVREVLRTMFGSPRFVEEGIAGAKVKNPLELVVSAVRATGGELSGPALLRTVSELGMPLYLCQPPTGYAEDSSSWLSAGSLLSRIRFAGQFASGRLRGVRGVEPPGDFDEWASEILLDGEMPVGDAHNNDVERLALVLASPAFQRH